MNRAELEKELADLNNRRYEVYDQLRQVTIGELRADLKHRYYKQMSWDNITYDYYYVIRVEDPEHAQPQRLWEPEIERIEVNLSESYCRINRNISHADTEKWIPITRKEFMSVYRKAIKEITL